MGGSIVREIDSVHKNDIIQADKTNDPVND